MSSSHSPVPFLQPSAAAGNTDSVPLPTAKQALTRVYSEDDNKRASYNIRHPHHRHRHTHSLGLLSPTASSSSSFASLISPEGSDVPRSSSSSNSFSSSPVSSQYHLPQSQTQAHEATTTSDSAPTYNAGAGSPGPARSHTTPTPLFSSSSQTPGRSRTPVRSSTTPTPKPRASFSPSPLVQRLLQPFALGRTSLPATPTPITTTSLTPSPLLSPSTSTMATIHQPAPQSAQSSYQPPSPTDTTHTTSTYSHIQRPSSRSERLLRDALLRDEMERHGSMPLPPLPSLASTSTTVVSTPTSPPKGSGNGHRRRHSHIPTSSFGAPAKAGTAATTTPGKVQDSAEYIRGSTMFRTAMSNPRSMSPPLRGPGSAYYGGDAEASPTATSGALHQQQYPQGRHAYQSSERQRQMQMQARAPQTPHTPRRHEQEQEQAATMRSTTGRSTSHSPSPLARRSQPPAIAAASVQSPSHTTAGTGKTPASPRPNGGLQRHHTVHASAAPSTPARGGASSWATPQQSPSRQRSTTTTGVKTRPPPIDLFSSSSSVSPSPPAGPAPQQRQVHQTYQLSQAHAPTYTSPPAPGLNLEDPGEPLVMTPHEQVLRARLERVLEQGRVVERKERRRSAERGRSASASRSGSSRRGGVNANEVRDEEGGWPWRDVNAGAGAKKASAPSVTSSAQYSSPSTGSSNSKPVLPQGTLLNAFTQPPRTPSAMHKRTRSKTDPVSPPPVASAGPSPRRSSTAPSPAFVGTPSMRAQAQHPRTGTTPPLLPEGVEGAEEHVQGEEDGELKLLTPPPTPPFTARIFSFSTPQRERDAPAGGRHQRTLTMGGIGGEYVPSPYKTAYSPAVQQLQLQQGRKGISGLGIGLPPSQRRPSSEEDADDASSSCSSNHRSNNSQASFPSSNSHSSSHSPPLEAPTSPPVNRLVSPSRPHFNARKASVQCRAMSGYVSFASVEGLGEPPAAVGGGEGEGEDGDEAERRAKRDKERGVLGIGASWGGWRKLLGVASGAVEESKRGEGRVGGVVL